MSADQEHPSSGYDANNQYTNSFEDVGVNDVPHGEQDDAYFGANDVGVNDDPHGEQDNAGTALDRLFNGVRNEMNDLKNQIAAQQADIEEREYTIDLLEKDLVQKEEFEKKLQDELDQCKLEVNLLNSELNRTESDKQSLQDLHAVNQRIRELKDKAESEAMIIKKQNNELLNFIWKMYGGYNTMVNKALDICADEGTDRKLQSMSEDMQKENEKIVQSMVTHVNQWDKVNTDYAASMALIFNQEKRRIALRKRFSQGSTPRKRLF